jgi:hypothetical protein
VNPADPSVARETYALLQSHFDLLWKVAGTLLSGAGVVISLLFWRLLSAMQTSTDALNNNTLALKELKDGLRDGR